MEPQLRNLAAIIRAPDLSRAYTVAAGTLESARVAHPMRHAA